MRRTAIVLLASMLALSFIYSTAKAADLFDEGLQVIDSEFQDEVFGGAKQPALIITFTPGDDLVDNGDYAVIVDVDGDGDFNDEPNSSYIDTGTATPDTVKSVTWNINSKLSSLNDGNYEIAVVIDNLPDGKINWGDEVKLFSVTDGTEVDDITGDLPGFVHDDLRSKFDSLSSNLTITGTSPWTIKDNDKNRTYIVREDGSGNLDVYQEIERDDDDEDFTLDRTLEITEVAVDPDIFSPNGDGVKDTTTIHYRLSESLLGSGAEVTIIIGEGQLTSPARPVAGRREGLNTVVWNGKDALGNVVEDGDYNIKIEAKDRGGNEATAGIQVKVRIETPAVVSTEPERDSFVASLTEVSAQLQDNSGEGMDLENSTIWLEDPNGNKLAGEQRDDDVDTIRYRIASPLPGDGSADGDYTIVITAVDKVGNTRTIRYTFTYDTIFPQITFVSPADESVLTAPPSKIVIMMTDGSGSGPDLPTTAQTVVVDGSIIPGMVVHNGVDTITFTPFNELEEGQYTVSVSPTDFAGNSPSQPMTFKFTVGEPEDILPQVVSINPANRASVNLITRVSAELLDNSGEGIDFDLSTITLTGPSGLLVPGVQTDDGVNVMAWELTGSLATNGSADGTYTIDVEVFDKDGGRTSESIVVVYDTQVPDLISVTPADESVLTTAPSEVVIVVNDGIGSGMDFAQSKGSMTLTNVADIIREDNGVDTMTFSFDAPEDNGEYTIQITLSDRAGNQHTYRSKFDFVDEPANVLPELASVEPAERSSVNALSQVTAVLTDNSGKGIDLDLSTIRLVAPGGVLMPGVQTDDDNNTMTWELISPLPTNGSADGTYTINVDAADKDGGMNTFSSTFTYDSQVPTLVSVTPANESVLIIAPDEVVIVVSDGTGSGVDFAQSKGSMTLTDVVNIIRQDDGNDTMTFNFDAPENTGEYIIQITLSDRAGNQHTYQSKFDFVDEPANVLPELASVEPADRSLVNALTQVTAVLTDNSERGIDLTLSTIRLMGPNGVEVGGVQTDNDNDTITWELTSPLPTDGSADGRYIVNINAVDKDGGTSSFTTTLVYDTQVPTIVSITPADGSVFTEAPNKVVIVVSDGPGSGVDFAFSKGSMTLSDVADIVREDNGVDTMIFSFAAVETPDTYTVTITLRDRAGNQQTYRSDFNLLGTDDLLPEVVLVYIPDDPSIYRLPDGVHLNNLPTVTAVLWDKTGQGMDLDSSTIRLEGSDGTVVPGIQINGGTGDVYVASKEVSDTFHTLTCPDALRILEENRIFFGSYQEAVDSGRTLGQNCDASGDESITWQLINPLATDGSADGVYVITVNAVDKVGGTTAFSSTFTFDTQVPTIVSITPADGSVLTEAPNEVVIVVSDGDGSGVNFASSKESMTLSGVSNIIKKDNGVDTMIFSFAVIEDTDTYTVTITLRDNIGNEQTYESEFDFVEKPEDLLPEVASVDPADRALVNSLLQVTAELIDNSGEGIDLSLSTIRLVGPDGIEVGGVQTTYDSGDARPVEPDGTEAGDGQTESDNPGTDNDNDTITWELISPLPTDGSVDGTYTINVNAVDKTGGTTSFSSTLVYDTQVSTIVSITPADGSVLTEAPNKVVIVVSDGAGSGLDFASSKDSMTLSGVPNIARTDNGVDTMIFSFAALEDVGEYTIQITLSDRAGNQQTYESTFNFVEKTTDVLPEVVSVEPTERAFVSALSQAAAVLADKSGKGIALDLSTIRLVSPDGTEVGGVQTDNNNDTITWELAAPLPTDGSVDGTYTINVNAVDKDGGANVFSSTFLYDTLSPSVIATDPAANDVFYEGISQATVQFDDGDGSGVDMEQTVVSLQGPNGEIETDKSDNGKDTITLGFSKLTDSGDYTIEISPRDRAGNAGYPVQIKFSYVLKPPAIVSISLTNRDYVSSLDSIEAVLEDRSGIGLDLSETGSSIVVTDPNGVELQADQTSNDVDTITWHPVNPLATDGTDDGAYMVTVTPVDTVGVDGQSRQITLIYDTQPPEVISASPVDINAGVTHVGQQLFAVQAQIRDEGPAGIEIEDQEIFLQASDETRIDGVQTDDGNDTVIWSLASPLPKDGTADGVYTLVVIATDQAGASKEFRYPLIYDTARPQLLEVSPADNVMLRNSITEVSARLEDSGDGEIDFQRSGIELRTPGGNSISGIMENNGLDAMTLKIAGLEENGTYTVLITAVDMAGNGADTAWETEFVFETGLPEVLSTVPTTNQLEDTYLRTQLREVRVTLKETDDGGIDFSPTGSKIRLRGPDGNLIIGSQGGNGLNLMTYTLSRPRATNGTEDGRYTILVTAVNSAKRSDEEREFSFIYDTQRPEVVSISNLNVNADLSFVSQQITELEVRLEDEGPAGIDVDRSSVRLVDPSGSTVPGDTSDDGVDTLKIEFPSGLPSEGKYSLEISAVDKAGNNIQKSVGFIFSVNLPEVIATVPTAAPAEDAYINTKLSDVRAELRATGNGGIDFSPTGSTIRLRGPKGDVPGVQSNESDILIFTLTDPLAIDGLDDGEYTISVTAVNAAKLEGPTNEFTFTYDTVAPEVGSDDISLMSSGEAGSSLSQISATITDKQPSSGIDWENFNNSWIKLQDSSGGDIPGEAFTMPDESVVLLVLDVPLASNGSQDGFYTVTIEPRDKAGNTPDPSVQYEFLYDTRPPTVKKAEITINEKILLLDSARDEYPTAVNTKNGVTIIAIIEDDGVGVDLTTSSINITGPSGEEVAGSLMQDGVSTIWLTTGLLNDEGIYTVKINPVDLHMNGSNNSAETITTQFLFEEKVPIAEITEPGTDEEDAEDEPIELIGTAVDEPSGEGIPVSGVAKVEIGGIGPGGKRLDWILAEDDSEADAEAWSEWSLDFLPDASGIYVIEIRVWDEAGNVEIYDARLELEFTISLAFQGDAYSWPNPVTNGIAHISFEINAPESLSTTVRLMIYDVSGDLVYEEDHMEIPSRTRTSVEWNCTNKMGEKVVTGIYIFRLEAELDDQTANKVGKPMIIKN